MEKPVVPPLDLTKAKLSQQHKPLIIKVAKAVEADKEINMPRCFKGFQRQKSRGQINSAQVAQTNAQAKESILEYKRNLSRPQDFKRGTSNKLAEDFESSENNETRLKPALISRPAPNKMV